jgi:hypothetical protein
VGALVGACLDVGVIVDFSFKKTFINLSLSLSRSCSQKRTRNTFFGRDERRVKADVMGRG